jgi:hypothetical protein
MSAQQRAAEALAMAEAADDPRDKQAFRAAAYAWERIAAPRYWLTEEVYEATTQLGALT